MACGHEILTFESSPHASAVGYSKISEGKLLAAATYTTNDSSLHAPSIFPSPLVLPDDDLALDPDCPPQSFRSWLRDKDRNPVTSSKNVVYIAPPPHIDSSVDFVQSWTQPQEEECCDLAIPSIHDVIGYLQACYHGIKVTSLPPPELCFTAWETRKKKLKQITAIPQYIGLNIPNERIGIRTGASPSGVFAAQLNLDDLLDAAISMLPADAYALLLLVNHDLYESDEDDFVCGRAYGASRVAVVSTARYHPILDQRHNVDRMHAWPVSHCTEFVRDLCNAAEPDVLRPRKKKKLSVEDGSVLVPAPAALPCSPMHAAVAAFKSYHLSSSPSSAALSALWLSRVCRTASHELGHCFGIEHCVYYACSMQASASLAEDARQPPYICPIDLAKVLHATGVSAESRYETILEFCERHGEEQLFASYAAWIRGLLSLTQ
ncbi:hypothetical protein H0H92_011254 [Tricholoma furcatifolium]|nr:hypothetical protein H0H92_011254 [Tricholoma furcatifolium]